MTTIGAGNVELRLGDDTLILKPSLSAARAISRQSGGVVAALRAVGNFDIDVIVSIVALGLNITRAREIDDLAERIYAAGLGNVVPALTQYLTVIGNGGRPVDIGGEGEPDPR